MKVDKALKREILHKNGAFAIIIFVFLALLVAGIMFASSLLMGITILAIPILVLPLIFAFTSLVLLYREGGDITFGNFGRLFVSFFSPHFRGTYCYLRTLLYTILVNIVFGLVLSVIVAPIFYHTNFHGFADFWNAARTTNLDLETLNALVAEYQEAIYYYELFSNIPASIIGALFAYYHITGHTFNYFLANSSKMDGGSLRVVYLNYVKENRWKFLKVRLANCWFIYLIFIGSYVLGVYLGRLLSFDLSLSNSFALAVSLFITIATTGFYTIAFEESLFLLNRDDVVKSGLNSILKAVNTMFPMDEEKKEAFEKDYKSRMNGEEPVGEEQKNDSNES